MAQINQVTMIVATWSLKLTYIREEYVGSTHYILGHSYEMICFLSPARMYFWKFPKNIIIIIAIIVPCSEVHQH